MKNLNSIKSLIIILTIFSFVACQNETDPKKPNSGTTNTTTLDTIPYATYLDWTSNWKTINGNFQDSIVRSFTMPVIDLTSVLAENPAASRFFLGYDTSSTPNLAHLMIVGVNSQGEDMIDYSNGLYVNDVSKPCPPMCGKIK